LATRNLYPWRDAILGWDANELSLREASSGALLRTLEQRKDWDGRGLPPSYSISATGKKIVTLDRQSDAKGPRLHLYETATGKVMDRQDLPMPDEIYVEVYLSPVHPHVAVVTEYSFGLWDYERKLFVHRFKAKDVLLNRTARFSDDGRVLAVQTHGGRVRLWDLARGQELGDVGAEFSTHCFTISPDGNLLVTGGNDTQIRAWPLRSGSVAKPTTK
jgi:WD40 repeat protein